MRHVLLAAVAASLIVSAPASAEVVELAAIGGSDPAVAVDRSGAGHFVWSERLSGKSDVTHYCRLPRGATTCEVRHAFSGFNGATNDDDFHGPRVLAGPQDGRVVVVTHRCCGSRFSAGQAGKTAGSIAYASADGGRTFSGGEIVGDNEISGDALAMADGRIATITDVLTQGTFFQAVRLGGYTAAKAALGTGDARYDGTLARTSRGLAAAFSDLNRTFLRVWAGAGDVNDVSAWAAPLEFAGTKPMLGDGTTGPQLLTRLTGAGGRPALTIRRLSNPERLPSAFAVVTGDKRAGDVFGGFDGLAHVLWTDASNRVFHRQEGKPRLWGTARPLPYIPTTIPIQTAGAATTGSQGWIVVGPKRIVAVPLEEVAGASAGGGRYACGFAFRKTRVRPCLVGPGEMGQPEGCVPGGRASFRLMFTTSRRPRSLSALKSRPPRRVGAVRFALGGRSDSRPPYRGTVSAPPADQWYDPAEIAVAKVTARGRTMRISGFGGRAIFC